MPQPHLTLPKALQGGPLVLDGATGTELERRGVGSPLPLWSAGALISHPDEVEAIHRDYAVAGADILVANTFRTNVRTLRTAGMLDRGEALNRTAVRLARQVGREDHVAADAPVGREDHVAADAPVGREDHVAAGLRPGRNTADTAVPHNTADIAMPRGGAAGASATPRQPIVAASVAPVEDCYHPKRVPDEAVLRDEHARMLGWLNAAGPDLVWIETMGTVREAQAAARAASLAEMPFVVSFVTREDGDLLGGEPLEQAVAAVEQFEPIALGLNCIPPAGMTAILPRLSKATARPLVAYAHINNATPIFGWSYSESVTPERYAEHARRWLDLGVSIVGGCCGTTPAHIRAVSDAVSGQGVARPCQP